MTLAALADPRGPLTLYSAFTTWQAAPAINALLTAGAAGYLFGVYRVARRHPARPWPARWAAAYLLGLAVIAVATESSIGAYDDVLFSAHMVQHLLLIMVAPPLLIGGRPVTLLLHAAGNPLHTWVKRAVRSRAVTALTWPPGTVILYAAVVAGTHLTPFMNLVLTNDAIHDAEHALYVFTGYLFFLPIVGSEPIRWRLPMFGRYLMLLATMPVDTAVGVALMLLPREPWPAYAHTGRTWGPGLVADLHAGGFLMFAGSDLIMAALGIVLAVGIVHGSPRSPAARDWRDGAATARTRRGMTGDGPAVPVPGARPAAGHGPGADLDAYNAYLASLTADDPGITRAGRRRREAPGPG
ncbi:MAG TPA: cytochrome c oxidase assembly protein [Streptosporangiaceae bacterium]|nr:cytochrome c oxidase assembly protein [Streptosporangiaceae bacterium]